MNLFSKAFFTLHMPAIMPSGPNRGIINLNPSSSTCVPGIQLFPPSLLPPASAFNRNLNQKQDQGLECKSTDGFVTSLFASAHCCISWNYWKPVRFTDFNVFWTKIDYLFIQISTNFKMLWQSLGTAQLATNVNVIIRSLYFLSS